MNPFDNEVDYDRHNFIGARLEAGHVNGKEFYACAFVSCSFRETTFTDCKFYECLFQDCDLSLMQVTGSSFRNTRFENSKVIGVNWIDAAWSKFVPPAPLSFLRCALDYSTFNGLSLVRVSFADCTAKDVDFSEANLTEADFHNTVLSKSRFSQTNLTRAHFVGATDYAIDVTMNVISKATFSLPEAVALLRGLDIQLVD